MRVKYGPFPDEVAALDKYYEFCLSPMDDAVTPDEKNAILSFCGSFMLYSAEWLKTSWTVRYLSNMVRNEYVPEDMILGELKPVDPTSPLDFKHVRISLNSASEIAQELAENMKISCSGVGHFIRNRANREAIEYIFTPNGKIDPLLIYIYFMILASRHKEVNEVEFLTGLRNAD